MADGYISAVRLPGNKTYNIRDKELIPRLKATVGHSNKNLLKIEANTQTISGVTFTVDKQAGTITINGQVESSASTAQLDLFPRQLIDSSLNGLILSEPTSPTIPDYALRTAIAYYDASVKFISEQIINSARPNPIVVSVPSNAVTYKIYIRVTTSAGTLNNLVIKPMLRDGNIIDDTFEPYQEPTDRLIETKARAYLNSTVGHACKNLLDINSQTHNSQVVIKSIDDKTGSIHLSTTGGTAHAGAAWYFPFEDGQSYTISFINLLENAHASVTIRRFDTNQVRYSNGNLSTLGNKSLTFTFTDKEFPGGAYVSLRCTDGTGAAGETSISELMVRNALILDDTFEPYQIPTDERFKDYLPLTGGTLTGQLIMSGKRLQLKGTNIDSDEAPSSNTWSNSELDFVDKDNTRISFLNVQEKTNGSTRLEIAAQHNNYYNVIDLIIGEDGSCSYYVSDPAAFRTAIGAGTSSTDRNVTQTNSVSGKYRPIMLGYDEYNSTTSYSSDEITNKVYKSSKLSFRPDRGILGIYGPCVGNTASDLISGKAGVLSYGDKGPQIEFNSAIQDSQAGAIIYTNNDSVATGASWTFVSNQADWNVISKRFHARTGISIGTELPQTSHTLYINGSTYATDSIFLAKTKGYYLTNSANNTYAAINDNGDNLWVGASSAQKEHHRGTNGQTYISSGWSTKKNSGNDTIFVSVPTLTTSGNTETWSHTAHAVLHNGNTSFTRTLSSGTKIGTIKINGVSTDLYCQTNKPITLYDAGETSVGVHSVTGLSNLTQYSELHITLFAPYENNFGYTHTVIYPYIFPNATNNQHSMFDCWIVQSENDLSKRIRVTLAIYAFENSVGIVGELTQDDQIIQIPSNHYIYIKRIVGIP